MQLSFAEEKEENLYKLWPANKTDPYHGNNVICSVSAPMSELPVVSYNESALMSQPCVLWQRLSDLPGISGGVGLML